MTQDEKEAYQRDAAALILASMATARGYRIPPPPPKEGATPTELQAYSDVRAEFERGQDMQRMHLAAEAFALAGALVAESELWAGPADQDGQPIDPRAMDRECVHGRKMSETCPECDQRHAAAKAGLPAEAASGEGTDTEG